MWNCLSGFACFFASINVAVLSFCTDYHSNNDVLLLKSVKLPDVLKILQHECKSTQYEVKSIARIVLDPGLDRRLS